MNLRIAKKVFDKWPWTCKKDFLYERAIRRLFKTSSWKASQKRMAEHMAEVLEILSKQQKEIK